MIGKEVWKPIKDYEGLYEVSNLGRVMSLSRKWVSGNGGKRNHEEIIMKPFVTGKYRNYYTLELSKDGIKKMFKVHHLVVSAFLNYTRDKNKDLVVDHINNDQSDNRLENLQIITNRENVSKDIKNATSKYTGVSWDKHRSKWRAEIRHNKIKYNLGRFKTELEAHQVYQNKLKELI
jgi:hypothetical protein